MSAPTSGSADSSPVEGFYPDPSIPGYIRYWSGAAWVPGTSRPAPAEGEPLPAPPAGFATTPAPALAAPVPPTPRRTEAPPASGPLPEETGPMFLDEEPALREARAEAVDPRTGDGGRGARAPWEAAGGPVIPAARDPRLPASRETGAQERPAAPGEAPPAAGAGARPGGTIQLRASASPQPVSSPAPQPWPGPGPAAAQEAPPRAQEALKDTRPAQEAPVLPAAPERQALPAAERPAAGGWAQQVHQLARQQPAAGPRPQERAEPRGGEAPAPWKPPKDDPFLRAAQERQGRPAPLGRRLLARVVDSAVLGAAVGAVAVPLWKKSADHIDAKVQQAKQSGQTVTVWLLDGTTGPYLGIVLGVLLLAGLVYEALPTAKWGRTLGKKLCGVRVLGIESHDTPSFGQALRRWLVYGVLGVLAVGVLNALWCLFDRPWRQCWHDKAARTFVASNGR
ncbi:RDD family protein [Streptomyces sp. NPDC001407]|uniref:RDD family protein n=1 Tax=unclassified Streptomyces TaxID=2593676 RepID=UPI0033FA0A91